MRMNKAIRVRKPASTRRPHVSYGKTAKYGSHEHRHRISVSLKRFHQKRKSLWIKGAIKHPGALHKMLHIKKGKTIPVSVLKKAEKSRNKLLRKRAFLADTLRKLRGRRRHR